MKCGDYMADEDDISAEHLLDAPHNMNLRLTALFNKCCAMPCNFSEVLQSPLLRTYKEDIGIPISTITIVEVIAVSNQVERHLIRVAYTVLFLGRFTVTDGLRV